MHGILVQRTERLAMNDDTPVDLFTRLETARAIRYLAPEPLPRPLIERLVYYATIADAVQAVMGPAMTGRRGATAAADRMYAGAAHLVSNLDRVPVLILVCAKNRYPPERPNACFVWSAG
jgi:hypothetical protein